MNKLEVWIGGLISAALSGAVNSFLTLNFVPGVHVDKDQWGSALGIAAVGAAIGVANFIKQSPLPFPVAQEEDKGDK